MRRALFAPAGASPPGGTLRLLNVLVLASLLGAAGFAMGQADATRSSEARRDTPVVEAVRHSAPAVVSVYATHRTGRNSLIRSAGSGVLVHPAGYVITNSHVIRGGSSVVVEMRGGRVRFRAQVVADLPGRDLALLRVRSRTALPYVSIARTRDVMLGETAIAIGNPHGLGGTITVGIVSALGRDAKLSGGAALRDLIQTDASINNGNSGGALLNLDGELIGIIVSLLPRSDGIAFAIRGDEVRALLQRALGGAPAAKPLPTPATPARGPRVSSSTIERPRVPPVDGALPPPTVGRTGRALPIKTAPLSPEDFGLVIKDRGAFLQVTSVAADGAARRAGVMAGDILATIDGRAVQDEIDLVLAFSATRAGRIYHLGLRRSGLERSAVLLTPR